MSATRRLPMLAAGIALLVLPLGLWLWGTAPRHVSETRAQSSRGTDVEALPALVDSTAVPTTTESAPPPVDEDEAPSADDSVQRMAALLAVGRVLTAAEESELAALEVALLGMGDAAVASIGAWLDTGGASPGANDRLFNILRRLPGREVERRLVREARQGRQDSMRTMAIESLAALKSDVAFETLADIARRDPGLPSQPLIVAPRDPDDTGTELPDETTFTPRMQAMLALVNSGDERAVPVLVDVVRSGPDEAVRMEAARNLQSLRESSEAAAALRTAAASDPSPYVRLAALHSLSGARDPELTTVLERIAEHDRDAGVRLLARRVLESSDP